MGYCALRAVHLPGGGALVTMTAVAMDDATKPREVVP